MRPLWGLDIGGTKIGVAVGDSTGAVHAYETLPTDPQAEPRELLDAALGRLRALQDGPPPAALGVACPGPMSSREGRFLDPPNMPRWHGFEVARALRELGAPPASLRNDANAGALAEHLWGEAAGVEGLVFLTMSTGCGAGLILGGRLVEGPDDLAGELGHLRLDPDGPAGFGKRGSVEGYLSGPGIVQLGQFELRLARQRGEESTLPRDEESIARLRSEELCAAAAAGDPVARRATDRAADALGRLSALLIDLLNPDAIVLGTLGSRHPELFLPIALEVIGREAIPRAARRCRLLPSRLGSRRPALQALAAALDGTRA